jgi:hypothetical protein
MFASLEKTGTASDKDIRELINQNYFVQLMKSVQRYEAESGAAEASTAFARTVTWSPCSRPNGARMGREETASPKQTHREWLAHWAASNVHIWDGESENGAGQTKIPQ